MIRFQSLMIKVPESDDNFLESGDKFPDSNDNGSRI